MEGYLPGYQPPDIDSWVKLNTNENPYPPSPAVVSAILAELGESGASLRFYPSASSSFLREEVGRLYGFDPSWVVMANGSDELLNNLIRACVDPGDEIGYIHPSYSYYATLAAIQGGRVKTFSLDDSFSLVDFPDSYGGKLLFLTLPNSPLGFTWSPDEIEKIVTRCRGVVVIDEAYADFSDQSALDLVGRHANVVVTRTLSKSYSLAGMRLGFAIAHPFIIQALDKIRDHYHLDRLAQAACLAALRDQEYFRHTRDLVVETREWFSRELTTRGFSVIPSSANFVFASPPDRDGKRLYDTLFGERILVRHFSDPLLSHGVRISVGTREEMERLLAVIDTHRWF